MGRKKRNSSLVQELINRRWTMDQEEFENKYNSLSLDDMCEVADAIDNMQNEYMDSDDVDDDDCDEHLSVYDAALIWQSNGKDEDYMFGYTEEELEDAL